MKNTDDRRRGWRRSGLRARYLPKPPICGGLITAAPWLNILIVILAFILLEPRFVLRPGVKLELPENNVRSLTGPSVTAVILSHRQSSDGDARSEIIFFEDLPFSADNQAHMQELKRRFYAIANESPETALVLEADVHVQYGTIARLCDMAGRSGLKTVTLAGRMAEERER